MTHHLDNCKPHILWITTSQRCGCSTAMRHLATAAAIPDVRPLRADSPLAHHLLYMRGLHGHRRSCF